MRAAACLLFARALALASANSDGAMRQKNEAFLFIKPHALNEKIHGLVRGRIQDAGMHVVETGRIDASTISQNSHIDRHYGVIANRAFNMHPSELILQPKANANFEKTYGLDWSDALAKGLIFNCKDAMRELDMNIDELDKEWNSLQKGVTLAKLGSGFYVGKVSGIYVVNGFYLAMRKEYVAEGAGIHYFRVQFSSNTMPWSEFRGAFLGATDPAVATVGSVRRTIYHNYEALDYPALPHTGTNGVHASASPLEAMVERMNWLGANVSADPFGKALLNAGVSLGSIMYWSKDPMVEFQGEMQSVFDLVEDMDFKTCKDVLVELGGRDAACSCPEKSLVPCGYFAWRSVSDHTLARRKQQCSSQALVCAGHFAKAYKSISEPTLSERLTTCQEKALICAGHFEQSFRSISEPTLQDRLAQCNETAVVCAGHFATAYKSISEPTLQDRLAQCNETAVVCAGHFAKAYKSISEPTLSERLATCQEKALICAGHFEQSFRSISEPTLQDRLAQCNETAVVCAGHFATAFKSISEPTLQDRLVQCNETAVVCAGHFQQSFRTLSDHSLEGSLLTTEDISNALKNILGKDSGDEPCITEECQDRTVELMRRLLRTSGNSGDDSIYSVVWGEDQLAMEHSFIPTADSNSSGSGSGTSCGSGKAADYITGRTSKTASVSKSPRHGASNGGGFAGVAAYDAKAK